MRQRFRSLVAGMVLSAAFSSMSARAATPPTLECCVAPGSEDLEEETAPWFGGSPPVSEPRMMEIAAIGDLKDRGGKAVFADDLFNRSKNAYTAIGGTLEFAVAALAQTDERGTPLFNAWDVVELWSAERQHKGVLEEIGKFLLLGFDGRTYAGYRSAGGTYTEAVEWRNVGYTPAQISRCKWLDLWPGDMTPRRDTYKPNALILYAATDWNHAMESTQERERFAQIQKEYDVWLRVVSKEEQAYAALRAVPNIALLEINGHGSKTALTFSESSTDERNTLDTTDHELSRHCGNLTRYAVVFLRSCSTGEGRLGADNLANFIAAAAPHRVVYAATEPFSISEFRITTTYPFRVRITAATEGRSANITYRIALR